VHQIKRKILEKAKSLLAEEIGYITDLPKEMQNTIANMYYKTALFMHEHEQGKGLPSSVSESKDIVKGIKHFFDDMAHFTASRKYLPGIISSIRELKSQGEQEEYELAVFIWLCHNKYRISDALNKSEMRLKIEKKLRQSKVDEIKGLYLQFQ